MSDAWDYVDSIPEQLLDAWFATSTVTFYGGGAGADAFQKKVETEAGVGISIGSHACTTGLRAYGNVKRIAFLSPYYPVANEQVR